MRSKNKILSLVNSKNRQIRIIAFISACFLIAVNYNLILSPNKLVIGGTSGLAIVINELTGMNRIFFLNVAAILLFAVSLVFLDKKTTYKALFGSLCFNFMVSVTEPLTKYITIDFESIFMILLLSAVLNGIASGIIYRSGYNTGGSDIIITILHKYLKIPMGKASTLLNIFIIGLGLITFGPTKTLYAIFILVFGNFITDIILLGIKDSKMCYIKSKDSDEISEYIINKMNIGITEISGRGGIFTKKMPVLLVIIPTDKYYGFKHLIKKIDNHAFILTINCYGVSGGYKRKLIPF